MKLLPVLLFFLALANYGCLIEEFETSCRPDCKNRDCGDNGCGGICGECPVGQKCEEGTCIQPDCCLGYPDGRLHVEVTGQVMDITTMQGIRASLQPVAPADVITDPAWPCFTCENWWESDENGYFEIPCQDVTEVGIGYMVVADDLSPDGVQGTYFPTGVGVIWWIPDDDKRCVYDARVYAVPNEVINAIDEATSVDSAAYGLVIGIVVDASYYAVEGAVIKTIEGNSLVEAVYPNPTMSSFKGAATSASGIFILPHTNFDDGVKAITAEKDGMTFETQHAAAKAGFCFFVLIKAI